MASLATNLALIDEAIEAIATAMADTSQAQSIKIRGREIERKDFASELNALISARDKLAPLANRESRSSLRVAKLGYPNR